MLISTFLGEIKDGSRPSLPATTLLTHPWLKELVVMFLILILSFGLLDY